MKVQALIDDGNGIEQIIIDVDARDRRAFEMVGRKTFGIPNGANLQEALKGMPETYVGWLIWHALKRTNNRKVDDWETFETKLIRALALEEDPDGFDFPTKAVTLDTH